MLAYLLFDCLGRPYALLGSNLLGNKRDHRLILLSLLHLFLLLLNDASALFLRQFLQQVSYYLHFDSKALSYFLLSQYTLRGYCDNLETSGCVELAHSSLLCLRVSWVLDFDKVGLVKLLRLLLLVCELQL